MVENAVNDSSIRAHGPFIHVRVSRRLDGGRRARGEHLRLHVDGLVEISFR
jgi:hypothetical protein